MRLLPGAVLARGEVGQIVPCPWPTCDAAAGAASLVDALDVLIAHALVDHDVATTRAGLLFALEFGAVE